MIGIAKICVARGLDPRQGSQTLEVRYRHHPAHHSAPVPAADREAAAGRDAFIELLSASDPDGPRPNGETPDELPFLTDAEREQAMAACWRDFQDGQS